MPQMSPLNWMMLYIYMLLILMIVNIILNYLNILVKEMNFKDNKILMIKYKWMW